MTRTIITADGTRLRDDRATRRTLRRLIIGALIIIGLIFASAAVIGLTRAALHPTNSPAPTNSNSVESFNDGWNTGLSDIQDIGNSPAGKAKILNCLSAGGNADTFHACLDR